MQTRIIKGKIQHYDVNDKYDDNGNRYKRYFMVVNGEKLTAHVPTDVYFDEKADIVLEVTESNEAIAGLIPYSGVKWGKTTNLKKQVNPDDKYQLVEGVVLEKRKETFTHARGTGSDSINRNRTTTTYTISLDNQNLRVEEHIGTKIKAGDPIAAAVVDGWIVALKNKASNKVYGSAQPVYIVCLILLIAFNIAMQYLKFTGQESILTNFTMVLIVINICLVLFTIATFTSYKSRNAAKKFLMEKLK